MKAVIDQKPWFKDPLAVRKKWDEEEYTLADKAGGKKLCFAILWDDGITVPHPPIGRALKMAQEALISAGHEGTYVHLEGFALMIIATLYLVVKWNPYKHSEIIECAVGGTPLLQTCYLIPCPVS